MPDIIHPVLEKRMTKKSLVMILTLMMIPNVALAWTYRAPMDSYPSIGGGFSCVNRSTRYGESIVDPTAPGPNRSLHGHITEGTQSAKEPFACFRDFDAQHKELYWQYYFKYSSNYEYNHTVDKHIYVETSTVHGAIMTGVRKRSDGIVYPVVFHGGALSQPYRFQSTSGNLAPPTSTKTISYNTWYKLSAYVYMGTSGKSDGVFKIWLNDTLIMHFTGIPLLMGGDTGANGFELTPVWGGSDTQYSPSGGMDLYFDELIISTEPIAGTSGGFSEGKIPNSPSILSVQ